MSFLVGGLARSSAHTFRTVSARRFASDGPTPPSRGGNTGMLAGVAAAVVLAGGAYLAMGGSTDPAKLKEAEDKLKAAVGAGSKASVGPAQAQQTTASTTGALSKDEWRTFKLKSIAPYNHNSSTFVFELPEGQDSGLTVASALLTRSADPKDCVDDKGKPVIRPYTPVTAPDHKGEIELLVKKYPNGKMTNHIHNLKPGDELAIKGPIPKFQYKPNEFETLGMIAGGSGITPMWQIMQEIDSNKDDKTKVVLIFSNVSTKDILLREKFDDLVKRKPEQFRVVYYIDKAERTWQGETGYINDHAITKNLPLPGFGDKIRILVCGPPPQVELLAGSKKSPSDQGPLKGTLADIGYAQSQVYKF